MATVVGIALALFLTRAASISDAFAPADFNPRVRGAPSSSCCCRSRAAGAASPSLRASFGTNDQPSPPPVIGTELFTRERGTPYVPYGMTLEEYTDMKAREEEEMSKKDFGMWGPRFQPSEDGAPPKGNWMVMPTLWTRGHSYDETGTEASVSLSEERRASTMGFPDTLRSCIRRFVPAFAVSFLTVHVLIVCAAMARSSSRVVSDGTRWAAISSSFLPARKAILARNNIALQLGRVCAALLLTRPMNAFTERMNRRWLWSRRRTYLLLVLPIQLVALIASWMMVALAAM